MTKFSALDAALNAVWAMETSALETLLTIAAREHDITPEALEAYRAKSLAGADRAQVRNGVAIISANGPLMKRASFFSAISGATSYEVMRRDLQAAADDPKTKGAILYLDTPGGEAAGANELAAYVASLRGTFPVVAYVSGMAASAGYWIAAGAQEIVVDATAVLGSIGVQMALRTRDDPKGVTTHTFISSQSPLKNADPGTDEGAAHIQSVVDAMAQVFVESVASYRGKDTETVLSDFGKGGIFVGQDAVRAGLADRVGNFEGVLAELSAGRRVSRAKGAKMSDETTYSKADLDAAVAAAVTKANAEATARVAAITAMGSGFGLDAAALAGAIASGKSVADLAVELGPKAAEARAAADVAAAAAAADRGDKAAAALTALQTDEQAAAAAAASKGKEPEKDEEAELNAWAERVAAS